MLIFSKYSHWVSSFSILVRGAKSHHSLVHQKSVTEALKYDFLTTPSGNSVVHWRLRSTAVTNSIPWLSEVIYGIPTPSSRVTCLLGMRWLFPSLFSGLLWMFMLINWGEEYQPTVRVLTGRDWRECLLLLLPTMTLGWPYDIWSTF